MDKGIFTSLVLCCGLLGAGPTQAAPVATGAALLAPQSLVEEVVVARRGYAARGPRGGVVAGGRTVVRPPYGRPAAGRAVVVAPGGWARPRNYWWRPGAAVAAGAAVGFVTAAAASSYAGRPPGPNYCWYYTDTQRTQGFWDACP